MGNGLRDDWFIEHTGETLILDQNKVAAELERLRDLLRRAEPHLGQFKLADEIRNALGQ